MPPHCFSVSLQRHTFDEAARAGFAAGPYRSEDRPLSTVFPEDSAAIARAIEASTYSEFAGADETNRGRCAQVAVATWAFELDKRGELALGPRDIAFVYQVGRIAAQEVDRALLPRLQQVTERLIAGCILSV